MLPDVAEVQRDPPFPKDFARSALKLTPPEFAQKAPPPPPPLPPPPEFPQKAPLPNQRRTGRRLKFIM